MPGWSQRTGNFDYADLPHLSVIVRRSDIFPADQDAAKVWRRKTALGDRVEASAAVQRLDIVRALTAAAKDGHLGSIDLT